MILASDVHPEAIRSGWTRSFRHNGTAITVAHEEYSITHLMASDIVLTRLFEPRLGEPERAIFDRAGCADRFDDATRVPAIFVAQWVRT